MGKSSSEEQDDDFEDEDDWYSIEEIANKQGYVKKEVSIEGENTPKRKGPWSIPSERKERAEEIIEEDRVYLEDYAFAATGRVFNIGENTGILKKQLKDQANLYLEEAKSKAEAVKQSKMLESKERFLSLKSEHEKEVQKRNSEIQVAENRIKQKEQSLDDKIKTYKT